MTKPLNIVFLLADGGRARLVRRHPDARRDFKTIEEFHADVPANSHPQGVAFASATGRRATVAERDSAVHHRHERFARELAQTVSRKLEAGGGERLALVAPARILAVLQEHLSGPARGKLAGMLAKDLTKTPDHDLDNWLSPLEL